MVYRGKPSKGCAACRQRRVKCERQPEGCANCQRANRSCPGYRNELDLAFCDETQRVRSKYRDDSVRDDNQNERQIIVVRDFLLPSMNDFSLAYFHHHHCARPVIDFVSSDVLLASMRALGAGSYSIATPTSNVELEATKNYVTAVQLLNTALRSPHVAVQDSTLLSVLILGYYEMITGSRRVTIDDWATHVKGTVALLRLRSDTQMETPDGRLLFLQASMMTLLECARRATRVPSELYAMLDGCAQYVDNWNDPLWASLGAHMKVEDLYSDVVHGRILDDDAIVTKALELDHSLSTTFDCAPDAFTHHTFEAPEDNESEIRWPQVHIYRNPLSAQLWNAARSSRIMLHWIIIHTLRHSPHQHEDLSETSKLNQIEASRSISTQLQMEILASVQQHVTDRPLGPNGPAGFFSDEMQRTRYHADSNGPQAIDWGQVKLPVVQGARGYQLLWSLAGIAEKGNDALRPVAREMMQVVGKSLGIRQAFALIEGLAEDEPF